MSFTYHASITAKGGFYDTVGMFTLMVWPIVACLYFTALLLLPQALFKTYWLRDFEFTSFKILTVFAICLGVARGLGYGWTEKSCSDYMWFVTWITASGF